jgi:phage protein U
MSLANEFFVGTSGGAVSPTVLEQARNRTAGGPYMAMLGEYQFSLETAAFEQLQRSTEYRWQAQQRIGRAPAHQFIGPGEDTIELQGTIYPHFRGGLGQMALMRDAASTGEPLPLIYAFENAGQYAGLWCIKSVKDGRSVFFRDGAARKIDFSISLTAYGEDADTSAGVVPAASSIVGAADALAVPALARTSAAGLLANSLKVLGLPSITVASLPAEVQQAAAAVVGAAQAAAEMSGLQAETIQRAMAAVITGQVPSLRTVLTDITRVAAKHDIISQDVLAAIKLVGTSLGGIQAVARSAEIQMRQAGVEASAVTGRVEGAAQAGTGSVVTDASLGNVVRAGLGIVFASNETARQLGAIAAKIKP